MPTRRLIPLLVLLPLLAACSSSNHLRDYEFTDERVAVVAAIPPRPAVFTDLPWDARVDPDDPIGSIFRAGTAIAKHAEARRAQDRMDSALAFVDVPERIAAQVLLDGSRSLGYRPVDHPHDADYLLDLRVADYGLVADSWDAAVHFEVDAELVLFDRQTDRVIWREHVRTREPISDAPGFGTTFGNVYTAATLSRLSVDDMIRALEDLAGFAAAELVGTLRHDFYESREERHAAR